jgi:hypothetical protein
MVASYIECLGESAPFAHSQFLLVVVTFVPVLSVFMSAKNSGNDISRWNTAIKGTAIYFYLR